jgi:hypothetical protein
MVTNDTLKFARSDRPDRPLPGVAVKKRDWLRGETAKTLENQPSRWCLSQIFHSLGVWLVLALVTLSGCTKLDLQDSFRLFEKDPKPEVPDRMVAVWTHSVLNQAGQPSTRGFGGRITFFGADDKASVLVDGKLTVYAFDDEREDLENPVPEKKFVFPRENLASHQSESNMGPSYSFWLPWGDVDGQQRRLSLIGRFDDASGKVVLSQSSSVTLPGKNGPPQLKVTKTESAAPRRSEYPVQPASYESEGTSVANRADSRDAGNRPRMQTTTIPITPNFANRLGTSTTGETVFERRGPRSATADSAPGQRRPSAAGLLPVSGVQAGFSTVSSF